LQKAPEQTSLAHSQPTIPQLLMLVALHPSPEQRASLQFAQGGPTSTHWLLALQT
jgi:hypothetical protein